MSSSEGFSHGFWMFLVLFGWFLDALPGEELDPKSFVLAKVFFPAQGYMWLTEQRRLETWKASEWRLYGQLKARETTEVDGKEVLLYEVSEELHQIL